jgi:hypothetical protein
MAIENCKETVLSIPLEVILSQELQELLEYEMESDKIDYPVFLSPPKVALHYCNSEFAL